MTKTQLKLRELRERQSKERGKMAELAVADNLTDETRAELDTIETGTPDLDRQIRAATSARSKPKNLNNAPPTLATLPPPKTAKTANGQNFARLFA